ncbi:MAG TPA: sugar transferase [Anaerolineales bacterium]|nr:sugar transferase [Anaerolineales bacterium]
MSRPYLSVVVPARDAADTLGACIRALQRQVYPREQYEVIVVDDGSSDATPCIAEGIADRVVRQHRRGPAAARNAGAAAAHGEIVVFTDSDCVPAADFLERLGDAFRDPDVVAAKGAYRTAQHGLVPRFVQQEYEHKYDRMLRQATIDFVDTYAAAYRREVFLENGGFDVSYTRASVEDQELSFRLARKGYPMVFIPSAVVEHRHDRSVGEYVRRKFGIGYWKAFLLRDHPERLVADSHTPLTQRLQLVLVPLASISLLLGLLMRGTGWLAAALACGVILTAVPEVWAIARRDPPVLVISPAMILLRAICLGAGLALGTIRPTARTSPAATPPLLLHQRLVKRAVDVVVSLVGLVLSLPVLAVAALAITLDSRGPVFFIQERVGLAGRRFRMVKLRTMVAEAEARLEAVRTKSCLGGPAFKIPHDPRVTRVGRWLRRWSVDELPQLWNVLRGEMSLVGPRPEEVHVVEKYSDWHRRRLSVPPGLTGPMQVSGRGVLDLDERVRLELEYIEHYSIARDLRIIAQTLPAVLSGTGAL